jgi:hypothetical protein
MEGWERENVLIHFPSFIHLCDEYGLRILEIGSPQFFEGFFFPFPPVFNQQSGNIWYLHGFAENMTRFYEMHRIPFSALLSDTAVLDKTGKIPEDQRTHAHTHTYIHVGEY